MTRTNRNRLKHFSALSLVALTTLSALPAFAQSDAERNVIESGSSRPVPEVDVPVVPQAQAQAPADTSSFNPGVSFQPLGSRDFHLYVDLNLHAYHFDREAVKEQHFNENNWGGGLEYTNDVVGVMGGYYRNSIWRPSWYLLGRYTPLQFDLTSKDRVNVGILAGALSGYTRTSTKYAPGYMAMSIPEHDGGSMPEMVKTETPVGTTTSPRGIMPAAGLLVSYEHNHEWGVNLIAVPNYERASLYGFVAVEVRIAVPKTLF